MRKFHSSQGHGPLNSTESFLPANVALPLLSQEVNLSLLGASVMPTLQQMGSRLSEEISNLNSKNRRLCSLNQFPDWSHFTDPESLQFRGEGEVFEKELYSTKQNKTKKEIIQFIFSPLFPKEIYGHLSGWLCIEEKEIIELLRSCCAVNLNGH